MDVKLFLHAISLLIGVIGLAAIGYAIYYFLKSSFLTAKVVVKENSDPDNEKNVDDNSGPSKNLQGPEEDSQDINKGSGHEQWFDNFLSISPETERKRKERDQIQQALLPLRYICLTYSDVKFQDNQVIYEHVYHTISVSVKEIENRSQECQKEWKTTKCTWYLKDCLFEYAETEHKGKWYRISASNLEQEDTNDTKRTLRYFLDCLSLND